MTSREAKSILNAYRNRNYNSIFHEYELAKAIDTVLPRYVELENENIMLKTKLAMYEELVKLYEEQEKVNNITIFYEYSHKISKLKNQIESLDKKCDGACEI